VAGAEPLYSPEYVDGAQDVLRRYLVPRLFGLSEPSAADVGPALAPVKGHVMAKAALETAVLDAELRTRGESFGSYLGAVRDEVDCGVSVGIMGSVPELLDAVANYLAQGYRRIKLKIEPGWDIEPVRSVRERFGDILLQVDANTAYRLEDAEHLGALDAFDLLLIEQPLPEDQILGHAELARVVRTPICLDESITSARSAEDAISLGACSIVNIKPGRVGGYLEARRVHDVCVARSIPVWCGGMLETGIGRAGNVALAALPNFSLPGDTSASDRYFHRDITEPFVMRDGRLAVPDGPGLGVSPISDLLEEATVGVETLRPA
jgi:O-succinylbenzoate synthase